MEYGESQAIVLAAFFTFQAQETKSDQNCTFDEKFPLSSTLKGVEVAIEIYPGQTKTEIKSSRNSYIVSFF